MPQFDTFPIRTTQPAERDPLRNFKFRAEFVGNESCAPARSPRWGSSPSAVSVCRPT